MNINDMGRHSVEIIPIEVPLIAEVSNLNPTEIMLVSAKEEVDVKIDRSLISPSSDSSSLKPNICIENITCKPIEVLSERGRETQKRINAKFKTFKRFDKLINAVHYLLVTFLDLDELKKSIRLEKVDTHINCINQMITFAAFMSLKSDVFKVVDYSYDFSNFNELLRSLINIRGCIIDVTDVNTLIERFKKYPDRVVRVKRLTDSFLSLIDEMIRTLQYIQELHKLPRAKSKVCLTLEDGDLKEFKKEFSSFKECMKKILNFSNNEKIKKAVPIVLVNEYFDLASKLINASGIFNEKVFYEDVLLFKNKKEKLLNIDENFADIIDVDMRYPLIISYVVYRVDEVVNGFLLNKFHVSEIDSIELSLIWDELKLYIVERCELIKCMSEMNTVILGYDSIKSLAKTKRMLLRVNYFVEHLNFESKLDFINVFESFMESREKTIESWVNTKEIFNYLNKEVNDFKTMMGECNVELQNFIDQREFNDKDEIDSFIFFITRFKEKMSPFLFAIFKLPQALNAFLVEGKDGSFKRTKLKSKSRSIDTQNNIKSLFNVNFTNAYAKFCTPKPVLKEIVAIEPVPVQNKVLSNQTNKPKAKVSSNVKAKVIKVDHPKSEPKVFQSNRVNDILEELKDRGWVKDHYNGSHLIFKKERELFTVPTNKSRVKDGLLSGLNRQITEKEVRIHNNSEAIRDKS